VLFHEPGNEVENLFLPPCESHDRTHSHCGRTKRESQRGRRMSGAGDERWDEGNGSRRQGRQECRPQTRMSAPRKQPAPQEQRAPQPGARRSRNHPPAGLPVWHARLRAPREAPVWHARLRAPREAPAWQAWRPAPHKDALEIVYAERLLHRYILVFIPQLSKENSR
jgi:hypothetical protein